MSTAKELFDGPFWIQSGLLLVICLLFGLGFLIGIPLAVGLTILTRGGGAFLATRTIGAVLSSGNIRRQSEYSIQESMVARGRFDEAAESFRAHLTEFPDDIPARYRLATLHLRERKDLAAAEQEFLNIRRRTHDRSTAKLLANHFVDIYQATGQTGKLMAELQRMIREWPETELADGARKMLEQVRRERGGE